MIEYVFLDLDDTILDFGWAERRALCLAWQELGIPVTEELLSRYKDINREHWELLERRVLTRDEVLVGRFAQLYAEYGIEADARDTNRRYEVYLGQGHKFIDGAEALLAALRQKYRLYLASNGVAATQAGRIASARLAPYFDGIFISENMGADKPSRAYFDRCFSQIEGFDPSRAVMIGDSLTSDILGGIHAGIHTVWFDPKHRPVGSIVPEYTVRTLAEIPALLETL